MIRYVVVANIIPPLNFNFVRNLIRAIVIGSRLFIAAIVKSRNIPPGVLGVFVLRQALCVRPRGALNVKFYNTHLNYSA